MGSNFVQGEASHVVSFHESQEEYFNNSEHSMSRSTSRSEIEATIESQRQEGVDEGLLEMMRNRISMTAPLLGRDQPAAGENPCIFRLPQRFKNINGKSYEPQMVSIGPYHRGKPHLHMMEEHKWMCLAYVLKRPQDLKVYLDSILPLEKKARECYSETINLTSSEFLEMMVLDGCFILELLHFLYSVEIEEKREVKHHPLAQMRRVILLKICGDLLFLENQIPSFVLEKLFQLSRKTWLGTYQSLSFIGTKVYSAILGIRCNIGDKSRFHGLKFLHLVDMVRFIFIPPNHEATRQDRDEGFPLEYWYKPFDTIPSVSKLRRAGIKVNPRKDCLLVAEFRDRVIEIPNIILNDFMCSFLVNCVAFEQCHNNSSKHFSVYALFLDCLVNTAGDVEYLCDRHVIDNYIGTDDEAACFINILGRDLTFDMDYINLWILFFNVNAYYQNRLNRQWTSFKREYFDKPWLWISALVALVLSVLTFLQTYYTIYYKK